MGLVSRACNAAVLAARQGAPISLGMSNVLRIASYNIRKCIGLDQRRRPERTAQVIAELNADIVVLQEADRRLGNRPSTLSTATLARTGLTPVPVATNKVSLGWHGNAILMRKNICAQDLHRLDLPGLEPRGAIIANLEHGGQPLRLVATHLGLTRHHRQKQLHEIRTALERMAPRPTLILGDFNEWSAHKGMDPLADGFSVHAPGRSFHAARPVARLDRIALCANWQLHESGVHESSLSARASDHLPIWAEISTRAPTDTALVPTCTPPSPQSAERAQKASGRASRAM